MISFFQYFKRWIIKYPVLKKNLKPLYKFIKNVYQHLPNKRKRIYFDITSYSVTTSKTGIQRVVAKFLEYLPSIVGNEYELICISGLDGYHIIDKDTFCAKRGYRLSPMKGDIYLSIDLNPVQPYQYWKTLEKWQKNGCKFIACVYDLVYIQYPKFVADSDAVFLLSRWLKHVANNFEALICISKSVENELKAWLSENFKNNNMEKRISYFYLGSDFVSENILQKDSTKFFFSEYIKKNIGFKFITVSTIEPRKGYIELIESFESASGHGANIILLIIGRVGWKCDDIVKKIITSNYYNKTLFWFSDCENGVLNILYSMSDCYVSNSYYEGFGLGVIEAANKGLPVLLRDIPVYREVSENKARFFKNGEELEKLFEKIPHEPNVFLREKKINSLTWKESVEMAWCAIKKGASFKSRYKG